MTANRNSSRNRKARRAAPAPAAVESVPAGVDETPNISQARWQEEYGYVFQDLRKLGIVAAALFAIIIIMGFFL